MDPGSCQGVQQTDSGELLCWHVQESTVHEWIRSPSDQPINPQLLIPT